MKHFSISSCRLAPDYNGTGEAQTATPTLTGQLEPTTPPMVISNSSHATHVRILAGTVSGVLVGITGLSFSVALFLRKKRKRANARTECHPYAGPRASVDSMDGQGAGAIVLGANEETGVLVIQRGSHYLHSDFVPSTADATYAVTCPTLSSSRAASTICEAREAEPRRNGPLEIDWSKVARPYGRFPCSRT